MEAPLVVVSVAAAVAALSGYGLAETLRGDWFSLSPLGWLIAAVGFGTFTAFFFWIDAALVNGRGGAPFARRRDGFVTAGGAAAAAAGGTCVFVPATLFFLFMLCTNHVSGTDVVCVLTTGLVFAASVAGGVACFRARRRLAAPAPDAFPPRA